MRGWSVLGSVFLMGSGVFLGLTLWLAGKTQKLVWIISSTLNSQRQIKQDKTENGRVDQVKQVEQVVRCGASCLSRRRHLHYHPSMMALT